MAYTVQEYQSSRSFFTFRSIRSVCILLGCLLALPGCKDKPGKPDVSGIQVQLHIARFDKALAALDTGNIENGLLQLKSQFPGFLDFYLDTLMGFGVRGDYSEASPGISQGLRPFLSHKDIRGLFDTVSRHFPETGSIEEKLSQGFRYLKHYFPAHAVPKIVYFISGLNQWSVITLDTSHIGIGLDMYLGPQYPFYHAVQIPQYVIDKCKPEYIPINVFQALYRNQYPIRMEDRTLLELMIEKGKEQYFLERVLPDAADSLRFGFTQVQLEWCRANEAEVYNYFITKNLLYEKSPNKVWRYVTDGPTSAGMPAESPGNIGSWLGYRILKAYIENHPELDMQQIFEADDAQRLLQESKYKPK